MGTAVNISATAHWHPGEDKSHIINVIGSAGTAVAMSGWALKYSLRGTIAGTTLAPFTDKNAGDGITIGTSGTGATADDRASVDINAADTSSMNGPVYYVLERTDSGNIGVIAHGKIEFEHIGL